MTDKRINARLLCVEAFLLLLILSLGIKAVDLQILDSVNLTHKAEDEYKRAITIKGKRGEILDRNGNCLATTVDALSVAASPGDIFNPAKDARALAEILGVDQARLEKKLSGKGSFVWIKKKVGPPEVEKIRQLNLKGVFFKKDVVRYYPNRNLAAQILGITGTDRGGLEGIEYKYNDILAGREKILNITRDAKGKCFDSEKELGDRYNGNSLVLTIDRNIQFITESALRNAVVEHRGRSGMALVMRPRTGEVMAMAHYPGFNPNSFSSFDRKTWRNRAVIDPFEPGSVMKVFVAAAAMEQGYSTPKSIFFCENGSYRVGRNTVHDTHAHGWLTLKQIIKYSSNIGAVKLSEITGNKGLFDVLSSFGFGEKTGIGCPGESPGSLIHYQKWSRIDAGAIAFGQGVSVSALQLISAVSALANDGVLMKPLLIKEILNSDGTVREVFKPVRVRRAVSSKTALAVRRMMRSVVTKDGTGTAAAVPGYSVCGKTGTAQKVVPGGRGYSKSKYTSVFVGFAPEDHPELVTLVVVDEPMDNHYGGVVAAPAFKNIMEETLHYLSIPPDMGEKQVVAAVEGN